MAKGLKLVIILRIISIVFNPICLAYNFWWSGNTPHLVSKSIFMLIQIVVLCGLLKRETWAWWILTILTGFLTFLIPFNYLVDPDYQIIVTSPYPAVDIIISIEIYANAVLTFIALMLPSTKKEFIFYKDIFKKNK